ncbi:MAG: biopolymer transporter TolR [Cyclobacteriaceae bacterium]
MKPHHYLVVAFLATTSFISAQSIRTGLFDNTLDVGNPAISGETVYNATSQTYSLTGSGENMWFDKDEFQYAYKKLQGDFILRADVAFVGEGVDPHRKIGWTIRPILSGNGKHVSAVLHGDGLTSLQYREEVGGETTSIDSVGSHVEVIQLERRGNLYVMSMARKGNPLRILHQVEMSFPDDVCAGLFVCSHNPAVKETAIFSNVRIVKPAPQGLIPYREYIGSNLEVMDVETGHRKIIYQVKNSIQAPNWALDGQALIYNSEGNLYRFDLSLGQPEKINLGPVKGNNNDHVLSFDGKVLGISANQPSGGGSVIYYSLIEGSDNPVQVTPESPSYLHGWSPDGKEVIYTARRNDVYNLYKKNIMGGKEVKLTDTPGLDDGSEFSPDGEYIYFNSNRTGTMQLWRMKPDGKNPEQLTFDEFNDWFPHISPDGSKIVFLSYLPEVSSGDHPFYKHVYLRMMDINGRKPKVIACLYGGQGSINVPSWSPDSKKVAFVSNSVID